LFGFSDENNFSKNKLPKNVFLVMLFPREAEALQARQ
jgi:hypothetical protein